MARQRLERGESAIPWGVPGIGGRCHGGSSGSFGASRPLTSPIPGVGRSGGAFRLSRLGITRECGVDGVVSSRKGRAGPLLGDDSGGSV